MNSNSESHNSHVSTFCWSLEERKKRLEGVTLVIKFNTWPDSGSQCNANKKANIAECLKGGKSRTFCWDTKQFLFLSFPSRTSRMKYKLEEEEKIRHYQIFNIASETLSSFQSDKTTDFSSILSFAGSFADSSPGARAGPPPPPSRERSPRRGGEESRKREHELAGAQQNRHSPSSTAASFYRCDNWGPEWESNLSKVTPQIKSMAQIRI